MYAVAAGGRLREVVLAIGAAGLAVMLAALLLRRPAPLPVGLALVGGAYALYVSLHGGSADEWAPVIAAGLFVAAELGFWSLERADARAERTVLLRRVAYLGLAGLFGALVGSLVLGLTTSAGGSLPLEAFGVAAAVATVAAIALLASRSSV